MTSTPRLRNQMSYRKEKKYRLSYSDQLKLKSSLISLGLTKLHPSRVIHSKYFDTTNLTMFSDSEEGLVPRKKIRIRWYNNESFSSLETKISSAEGRFKSSKKIINKDQYNHVNESINDTMYGKILPTILVSYNREYYLLDKLKITFDSKISYTDLRSKTKLNFKDFETVMEIKTSIETPDDYIKSIVPYSTSRFSKYSRGILIANGIL